ncbi:GNAT family N-acetyltransferase [Streptomyces sp. NPDC058914]|uniref:GNAT family N-acetyltransferase n=1 Tax=Streptomyces sp. NPDC058914 TaxID=3346671 RepID=UPI0036A21CAB
MRPASPDDVPALTALIGRRAAWMRERKLEDWEGWSSSAALMAARAARPRSPGWVLEHIGGAVVGCTTVSDRSLDAGWTVAEQGEAALYLNTTVTDPAWRRFRPGALLAAWTLHRAATTGRSWVRRGCTSDGLLRYYRDVQGFALVRTVRGEHTVTHLLARQATASDWSDRQERGAGPRDA